MGLVNPTFNLSTKLADLIIPGSWLFFSILDLDWDFLVTGFRRLVSQMVTPIRSMYSMSKLLMLLLDSSEHAIKLGYVVFLFLQCATQD